MKKLLHFTFMTLAVIFLLGLLFFLIYKTQAQDSKLSSQSENVLATLEDIHTHVNIDTLRSRINNHQSRLVGGLMHLLYKEKSSQTNFSEKSGELLYIVEAVNADTHLDNFRNQFESLAVSHSDAFQTLTLKEHGQILHDMTAHLGISGLEADSTKLNTLLEEYQLSIQNYDGTRGSIQVVLEALPIQLQNIKRTLENSLEVVEAINNRANIESAHHLETMATQLAKQLMEMVAYNYHRKFEENQRLYEQLKQQVAQQSPSIQASFHAFMSTASLTLNNWTPYTTQFATIQDMSATITEQLNAFEYQLVEGLAYKLTSKNIWQDLLIWYSAGLLLFSAYLAWRLWGSFDALDKANVSLENRVTERTQALSATLAELKESQVQLIQSEKMASLGQMVAGVAHEINTPLAYARGGLEVIKHRVEAVDSLVNETYALMQLLSDPGEHEDFSENDLEELLNSVQETSSTFVTAAVINELNELVDDGLHGIDEIRDIVTNMKDFSRLDRARLDEYDVNKGIESTLKIAQGSIKQRQVTAQFGNTPVIQCAPSQINQVFLNLINNACQATGEFGSEIGITTNKAGEGVLIEVSDNGEGIAKENLGKIFDPFFTTKKVGDGTGLGLSIVHRIITDHGGTIEVTSEKSVGTRFKVWLPTQTSEALEVMEAA